MNLIIKTVDDEEFILDVNEDEMSFQILFPQSMKIKLSFARPKRIKQLKTGMLQTKMHQCI